MRKLIYSMTVSLDGYIAGPDGAIDWSVPDEELGDRAGESARRGVRRVRPNLEGPAEGRVLHDASALASFTFATGACQTMMGRVLPRSFRASLDRLLLFRGRAVLRG
jgi:hypothetical protein